MDKHERKKRKKQKAEKRNQQRQREIEKKRANSARALKTLQEMQSEVPLARIVQLFAAEKFPAQIAEELQIPLEKVEQVNNLVNLLDPKLQELLVAGDGLFLENNKVTGIIGQAFKLFDNRDIKGLQKLAGKFGHSDL